MADLLTMEIQAILSWHIPTVNISRKSYLEMCPWLIHLSTAIVSPTIPGDRPTGVAELRLIIRFRWSGGVKQGDLPVSEVRPMQPAAMMTPTTAAASSSSTTLVLGSRLWITAHNTGENVALLRLSGKTSACQEDWVKWGYTAATCSHTLSNLTG